MGNLDSVESRANLNLRHHKLHFVEKLSSSLVGQFSIYRVGTTETYLMAKKIKDGQFDYEFRSGLSHPNLLKTLGYDVGIQHLFGASLEDNNIYFEIGGVPVESIVNRRIQSQQFFTEQDLIRCLKGVTAALALLQDIGTSHGDINSQTVFYEPTNALFKVYDHELLAGQTAALKNLLKGIPNGYNTPEHVVALVENDISLSSNQGKSDVFSLGMVLLEMGSLKKSADCYDGHSGRIYLRKLDERLDSIRGYYSKDFINILESMLQIDPENRPDPQQLQSELNGKKTIIINTKTAGKDQLPTTLDKFGFGPQSIAATKVKKMSNSTILEHTLKSAVPQDKALPGRMVQSYIGGSHAPNLAQSRAPAIYQSIANKPQQLQHSLQHSVVLEKSGRVKH